MTPRSLADKESLDVPDAELAARAARGDQAAFERIMRRHNRTLFRTARAILKDDEEAEDAVQEAYLQAYGALGEFRGDAKLSTWLARIVANQALQRLRKRERRAQILPLRQPGGAFEPDLEEAADVKTDNGPEAAAQSGELRRVLEAQIDALPDSCRAVFMLRAVEELTVEETAAVLGIPQATVRSRFFRARSLLREALALKVDLACEDAFAFAGERCDRVVAFVLDHLDTQERI
jgi:RNA polymerase sigma-70 factor (ECF subfamily)